MNTHHHGEMIREYLKATATSACGLRFREEEELLDTGGGLKKAAWFLLESGGASDEPFLVHNVDVISTIDLDVR